MSYLPKPTEPLRILTIDGGGLQGVSPLLILNRLLVSIADGSEDPIKKPRPCDVFDVIAGYGAGGWLALLLGRFRMDVVDALTEWHNLISHITPSSKAEQLRMRMMEHTYFDTERLVEHVDKLADLYKTGKHMFSAPTDDLRCKHVFVSAPKMDLKDKHHGHNGYYLFRTYECPANAIVLDGPPDPCKYKISHAFGVTGAAKYFTSPWEERFDNKIKTMFWDVQFPTLHNITGLALGEVWGLYGTDVEIAAIVNIGPGLPTVSDCKAITRRFGWGGKTAPASPPLEPVIEPPPHDGSDSYYTRYHQEIDQMFTAEFHNRERRRQAEKQTLNDVELQLQGVYPSDTPPCYRFAPYRSTPGAAQEDTLYADSIFEAVEEYLRTDHARYEMQEASQRLIS